MSAAAAPAPAPAEPKPFRRVGGASVAEGGYFTEDSVIRRVQKEYAMAFGGPRALLLMAAHPVAFEGFFAHTGALDDPYARLRRTAQVLETITFGSRQDADRLCRRVRAMHGRVSGVLAEAAGPFAAGTPYRADDPALLLWILACLADSNILIHERYVRRWERDELEGYWRDFRVIGRLFGLGDDEMPTSAADFRDYMDGMIGGGELHVTDRARELGIQIVLKPPVPTVMRPVLEMANFITVGLLPPDVRRGYGLSWDPLRGLALLGGAEYTRRVLMPLLPGRLRRSERQAV